MSNCHSFCRRIILKVARVPGIKSGSRYLWNFTLVICIMETTLSRTAAKVCSHLVIVYGLALLIASLALYSTWFSQTVDRKASIISWQGQYTKS